MARAGGKIRSIATDEKGRWTQMKPMSVISIRVQHVLVDGYQVVAILVIVVVVIMLRRGRKPREKK